MDAQCPSTSSRHSSSGGSNPIDVIYDAGLALYQDGARFFSIHDLVTHTGIKSDTVMLYADAWVQLGQWQRQSEEVFSWASSEHGT